MAARAGRDKAKGRSEASAQPQSRRRDTAVIPGNRISVHQNTREKVLEALEAPIVLRANPAPKKRDADEQFLLSLLPDLKGLPPQEKTHVKIKILQVIQDVQGP